MPGSVKPKLPALANGFKVVGRGQLNLERLLISFERAGPPCVPSLCWRCVTASSYSFKETKLSRGLPAQDGEI